MCYVEKGMTWSVAPYTPFTSKSVYPLSLFMICCIDPGYIHLTDLYLHFY